MVQPPVVAAGRDGRARRRGADPQHADTRASQDDAHDTLARAIGRGRLPVRSDGGGEDVRAGHRRRVHVGERLRRRFQRAAQQIQDRMAA